MQYKSTRGGDSCNGVQAVLRGLAADGGLFSPQWDMAEFDAVNCLKGDYTDMAEAVLKALLPDFENMGELVRRSYEGKFDTECPTPLVKLGEDYILELWHGPTSAFKDMALSVLPLLISAGRRQEGVKGKSVILTATSGDTGKAALEGFHDVEGTEIFVFYPQGGVSPIQERQMLTQEGKNVHICAVEGNFDDCQSAVKAAFSEINSKGLFNGTGLTLSSANSINIGRLAPQVAYYFSAYAQLLDIGRIKFGDKVDFAVPTGNFGDILALWYARLMGLPVGKLICASNANRVLTDFFSTGCYDIRRDFYKSSSPSMDILVSSNLERLIYMVSDKDTELVRHCMDNLRTQGHYELPKSLMDKIREFFAADCCGEEDTVRAIKRTWQSFGYLCDPHTAVALKVAESYKKTRQEARPLVTLSTASPYKFPAVVLSAIGGKLSGDEFSQLHALSELTGTPIPKNLAKLESLPVLHGDALRRDEMLPYILCKTGVTK